MSSPIVSAPVLSVTAEPDGAATGQTGQSSEGPRQVWDAVPVIVSLLASFAFIIRYPVSLIGGRAFVLVDDAAISMTYARNFADGHGLLWNVGQHPVEGYSNFLWTMWMAAIEAAHPSDRMAGLWVMLSSAVLLAANAYIITRIARRLLGDAQYLPIVAGLAASTYYALNSWSLVGMETGLVAFLCSLAVLISLRACDPLTSSRTSQGLLLTGGLVLALGVLTRDDVLVVAAVIVGFVVLRMSGPRRWALLVAIPVGVAEVGHVIFRLLYYGYPVPNTYFLKVGGIPESTKLGRGLVVLAQNSTLQLVLPACLAAAYFVLARRTNGKVVVGAGLLAAVVGAQAVYMVMVGGDSYDLTFSDRYLAPVVPLLFVLAVLGAAEIGRLARRSGRPLFVVGVAVLVASLLTAWAWLPVSLLQQPAVSTWHITPWIGFLSVLGLLIVLASASSWFRARSPLVIAGILSTASIVATSGIPYSSWVIQNYQFRDLDTFVAFDGSLMALSTPPNATIGVTGAGNVTFFSHRRAVDLLGYSDHTIATSAPHLEFPFQPGHDKWNYDYSIGKLRPDVVLGLFHPTPADQTAMKAWGYRKYTIPYLNQTIYYLPGWFHPS